MSSTRRHMVRWGVAIVCATLVLVFTGPARAQSVNWRNVASGARGKTISVSAPRVQLLNGNGGTFDFGLR